jgi:hypothetical protein
MTHDQVTTAPCPKCRTEMVYVTAMPHPKAPERATFACYVCNQTRTYSLSPAMAEAYAVACATDVV